jgi:hypothetical protein
MLRMIAIFAFFAAVLSSLFAPLSTIHPNTVLIGGEYTVQPGEVRHGDMLAFFARVKIAEGGEVAGQVHVYGGELDVAGVVENIQTFGSKLTVDSTAKIAGDTHSVDYVRVWFLLPSILLVVS